MTSKERSIACYRRQRAKLIKLLGGKCVHCGEKDTNLLEFNHLQRRQWVASKVSRWCRIARYRREYEAGLIELACGTCNKKLGQPAVASSGEWVDEIEGIAA